jgi:hypothetical protein
MHSFSCAVPLFARYNGKLQKKAEEPEGVFRKNNQRRIKKKWKAGLLSLSMGRTLLETPGQC